MLVNGKHFHKMFQIHWVCGIQNTVTFFEDNTFLSQLQRIKTPFKSKKICDIWKLSLFPSIRMLHLHLYHSCYMAEVQVFMNADLFPLQIFSIESEQPQSAVTKVWVCSFVETALWLLWPLFTCLFIAPPPDCISDFCDHPIWQPGIWQAQISLSANFAFYLFSPFSALVHEQTNFLTGFENIMFSLTVSWLYRCNILRALPYQKLFVLNWCSVVWWPLKVLLGNKFKEHPSWIQSGRVRF